MSTKQRLTFVFLFASPFAFGQAERSSAAAPAAAVPQNPQPQVLLASNAAAPEALVAPAPQQNLLIHPPVLKPVPAKPEISMRERAVFYSLIAAEHGAAVLDAWSTRQVLQQGGRELDPLVRPFAHSATLYPALQVTPVAVDYFAAKLMRSNHPVLRKLWWVPQVVATSGSVYCGIANLGNRR
jgi:hypothetical protein